METSRQTNYPRVPRGHLAQNDIVHVVRSRSKLLAVSVLLSPMINMYARADRPGERAGPYVRQEVYLRRFAPPFHAYERDPARYPLDTFP